MDDHYIQNQAMDNILDFDGTVVTNEFLQVGEDIGAVPVLKELVDYGHSLILFTMRSNMQEEHTKNPEIVNSPGENISPTLSTGFNSIASLYMVFKSIQLNIPGLILPKRTDIL